MRSILAAAALAMAAPAAAQDGSEPSSNRTPENAQKFLSELPKNFDLSAANYGANHSRISAKVTAIRDDGRCASVIDGVPTSYVLRDANRNMKTDGPYNGGRPGLFAPHAQEIAASGMVQAPYRVEWGKIPPVVQSPPSGIDGTPMASSVLRLQTDAWAINIFFPSGELASRAMLAMETLRIACDPMGGMGF